jgi:galactokinase
MTHTEANSDATADDPVTVLARAPGRVNLIGDHTDYTGGLVFPMAIDRYTEVELQRGVPWVELVSANDEEPVIVFLDEPMDPATLKPPWARYIAGVVAVTRPAAGGRGFVRTTVPIGAGLSSSAALEVSIALALGFEGSPLDLALACQQAEQLAAGVPCGVMDQLAAAAGVEGHALLIDCTTLTVEPVPVPEGAQVVVVDSGQRRSLTTSFYGVRRAQAEEAATLIGPLRMATRADAEEIATPVLRHRARHVVTENERVRAFAKAFGSDDLATAGELMLESHASLRDDFEVSTPVLDQLVETVAALPGVHGARLTGAGFGGCVVALADADATIEAGVASWSVRASAGASVTIL